MKTDKEEKELSLRVVKSVESGDGTRLSWCRISDGKRAARFALIRAGADTDLQGMADRLWDKPLDGADTDKLESVDALNNMDFSAVADSAARAGLEALREAFGKNLGI